MFGRVIEAAAQAVQANAPILFMQVSGAVVAAVAPEGTPGVSMLLEVKDELAVLAFAGVAGAFVKAVMFPASGWRRRAMYGLSSAVSAVFLGGVVGALAVSLGATPVFAFLAAGFLTGFAGKDGIAAMQARVMGKPQ